MVGRLRAYVSIRHHPLLLDRDVIEEMVPVPIDGSPPKDDLEISYKTRHGRTYHFQLNLQMPQGLAKSAVTILQTGTTLGGQAGWRSQHPH
jgi:hypothetical protein